MTFFYIAILFWLLAWGINVWLSKLKTLAATRILAPILFGVSIIVLWESSVYSFNISYVILPAPSQVFVKFFASLDILWLDFVQTFLKDMELISFLTFSSVKISSSCIISTRYFAHLSDPCVRMATFVSLFLRSARWS